MMLCAANARPEGADYDFAPMLILTLTSDAHYRLSGKVTRPAKAIGAPRITGRS